MSAERHRWSDERLFGEPGDEYMDADMHDTLERLWAERLADGLREIWCRAGLDHVPTTLTVTVEEWSVAAPGDDLPTASDVREWIVEQGSIDSTEDHYEHLAAICESDEVQAAIQVVLDLIAAKQTYKMADRLLATHTVEVTTTSPTDFEWRIIATDGVEVVS